MNIDISITEVLNKMWWALGKVISVNLSTPTKIYMSASSAYLANLIEAFCFLASLSSHALELFLSLELETRGHSRLRTSSWVLNQDNKNMRNYSQLPSKVRLHSRIIVGKPCLHSQSLKNRLFSKKINYLLPLEMLIPSELAFLSASESG